MVVFSSREDGEKRFKATIPSYFRWTPFCNQIFLSIIDEQIQLSRVVRFLRSRNVKRIWKARLENYINKNKREERRKKNKSIPDFLPLFSPSLSPSLSYLVYRNYQLISGIQTARHDLHTRSCTPEHRDPNRADIYLFVHLSLCNGTPANSIRNIYIYIYISG